MIEPRIPEGKKTIDIDAPMNSMNISIGVKKPHTGHSARIKLQKVRIGIPKESDDADDSEDRDQFGAVSFVVELVDWDPLHVWEVDRHVEEQGHVDSKAHHRKVEEEHDSVRVLPQLSEEVRAIDQEARNRHPTCISKKFAYIKLGRGH